MYKQNIKLRDIFVLKTAQARYSSKKEEILMSKYIL